MIKDLHYPVSARHPCIVGKVEKARLADSVETLLAKWLSKVPSYNFTRVRYVCVGRHSRCIRRSGGSWSRDKLNMKEARGVASNILV